MRDDNLTWSYLHSLEEQMALYITLAIFIVVSCNTRFLSIWSFKQDFQRFCAEGFVRANPNSQLNYKHIVHSYIESYYFISREIDF